MVSPRFGYTFMLRADSLLPIDLGQFPPAPDRGRTPHARIAAEAPPTADFWHLWEGLQPRL